MKLACGQVSSLPSILTGLPAVKEFVSIGQKLHSVLSEPHGPPLLFHVGWGPGRPEQPPWEQGLSCSAALECILQFPQSRCTPPGLSATPSF